MTFFKNFLWVINSFKNNAFHADGGCKRTKALYKTVLFNIYL